MESSKKTMTAPEINRKIGEENRERVRRYFSEHLCATNIECAQALGLNACVVGRHVKAIRSEWNKHD